MGWDSPDGEVAHLLPSHIIFILQQYLSDRMSEQEVEDWANLLEVREDITFGAVEDEDTVIDVIHILANPVLEGPLTQMRAQRLVALLEKGMPAEEQIDKAYP